MPCEVAQQFVAGATALTGRGLNSNVMSRGEHMRAANKNQFVLSLKKTISWCHGRSDINDPAGCFRSDALRKIVISHGEDPEAAWLNSRLIADVLSERDKSHGGEIEYPVTGRVLLSAYEYTNHNGLTFGESSGYFDEHDCPPWDTWICEIPCIRRDFVTTSTDKVWPSTLESSLSGEQPTQVLLASWVPREFESLAQQAIEVECCGMLLWADRPYPDSELAPKYAEVIPEWFKDLYQATHNHSLQGRRP